MDEETQIAQRFKQLSPHLNERDLRLFVATEANSYGRGGVSLLYRITGLARTTIKRGQDELKIQASLSCLEEIDQNRDSAKLERSQETRLRRPGGGRKKKISHFPNWVDALEKLVEPVAKGDPESSLRWTIKSTKTLSDELSRQGFTVSPNTVMRQLYNMGYSLHSNVKIISELGNHPDRNQQFLYIIDKVANFINSGDPVISIDTKKKEIMANFKNQGQKWEAKGSATEVNDHDFPNPSLPRALPFGVYDIKNNIGHVTIGTDHDTSEFAANSIYGWWKLYGESMYKDSSKILITADSGGSNGYRIHLWKYSLQNIADKIKLPISACHFPPGTSKWNKIEHKLFSFISSNWRGEPLINYETVVKLISSTKTSTGLTASCVLDYSTYQTGIKLTKDQISSIKLEKDNFHGEWNYTIFPH
ncbi:MAG: ISAzo13 family transposase [Deltaproteobacteria bacterium]|jgi:hypothetical protein|nr:ISAzo13 family transposase [Deltaproteobacteria bacterium]